MLPLMIIPCPLQKNGGEVFALQAATILNEAQVNSVHGTLGAPHRTLGSMASGLKDTVLEPVLHPT